MPRMESPAIAPAKVSSGELSKSERNLVWVDCEMTGLHPETDRLLEIAVVVTGPHLEARTDGPVLVLRQEEDVLGRMDKWNRNTHAKTGLLDKVRASTLGEEDAQGELLAFLARYVPAHASPMCGDCVSQDRRFLVRYLPHFDAYFHYRNLDVATLRELARRWAPEVYRGFRKKQRHTALADVHEAIDALEHYRRVFLQIP
ncbi:oligoribonuclease [Candidatus Symbiobacter mobilis]|uniref:Oligoribonuclease n=1 Tax=Candidatus Symbiobacter mobilis CR TaxID=946483 RepID=U5NCH2_9BURK|nr:oligoribonuclease [Candidatus Symbiobacter mobilis]AGX87918.1 oligoribonuclease [Candidatus Symbiobacter mobilis CR]